MAGSLASYTPNMYDINPNCLSVSANPDTMAITVRYFDTHWQYPGFNKIPVCGYKRIKVRTNSEQYTKVKYRFQLADGSFTEEFTAASGWSDWITIPENATMFCCSNISVSYLDTFFSLSTSES